MSWSGAGLEAYMKDKMKQENFFKMCEENQLPVLTKDELYGNIHKCDYCGKACDGSDSIYDGEKTIMYCGKCEEEKPKPKKKKLIIKGSDEWREKRLKKLNKQLKQEKEELAEYLESINK